jgi:hypothetical protein
MMLEPDLNKRATMKEVYRHPWLGMAEYDSTLHLASPASPLLPSPSASAWKMNGGTFLIFFFF